MVDMDKDQDIVDRSSSTGRSGKRSSPRTEGNGFIVAEEELVANTRKGKQVMNVKAPDEAKRCVAVDGDHLAIIGENRKLLVFPWPSAGDGARQGRAPAALQGRRGDGHSASPSMRAELAGFAERIFTRSRAELAEWIGARASAAAWSRKDSRTGRFGG